jgi:hypothetical protein
MRGESVTGDADLPSVSPLKNGGGREGSGSMTRGKPSITASVRTITSHTEFDRFYRVDPSRSRRSGGRGLGLSIAQRIAQLHNATLTVESRLGEGSEFKVQFE